MAETSSETSITWTASEFIDHQRGAFWYVVLAGATAVLAGLIYMITKDYFPIGVIVLLGIIIGSVGHWKPRQVQYRLTDKGIHIDDKFLPYSQFKFFSIVHESNLSTLVMTQTKRYLPPLSAFIDAEDEIEITDLIGEHLPLQPGSPDTVDRLSRRLRF
jgi:hypothetical protein